MYRFFLALRYIAARPISWISMIGIWITVTSAIVTLAIMTGFLREISNVYRGEAGDVVITPRPYRESGPTRRPKFEAIRAAVEKVPGVAALSPHLLRPVLLRVGVDPDDPAAVEEIDEDNFAKLYGVDPILDVATTDFAKYVADARAHRVADPARPFDIDRSRLAPELRDLPVVLVGSGLREQFDLEIGDKIEVSTLPDDDSQDEIEPITQAFVVGGAVRCGHYRIDLKGLYVDIEAARAFARTPGDATEICLKADEGVDAIALASAVQFALGAARLPAEAQSWQQRHVNDLAAIRSQRSVLALLLFFFVLVACFNVFATMTILVTDKIRDIGTLAAMGASPTGLLTVFVTSGFVMSFVSSVAGSATGAFLARHINDVHDWIEKLTGVRLFKPDVYFFDRIPIELQGRTFPLIVAATVFFAVLCAAIPAVRAARLDPVRALRQE